MIKHDPSAQQPIGIFDSGIGGLTVVQAVVNQLPHENIIYFGDTAHMPYGEKSAAAIQTYSLKIANLLLQRKCKLILIACYSATSAAFELVKDYVGTRAIVMDVIGPMVQHLQHHHANKKIGFIGTRHTVNSEVYKQKISALNNGIQLTTLATNLLASAIEEFGDHIIIDSLLNEYLSHSSLGDLDTLILACTHYPVIKNKISNYFKHKIEVIDPCEIVAHSVKLNLEQKNLLNKNGEGSKHFYVSDYTESFAAATKIFFGDVIHLEHYPLWK